MSMETLILGIESSCDECSASVLHRVDGKYIPLSVSTFSQIELHQPFGGVVPEVASRNHLEQIQRVIESALAEAQWKGSTVTYQDLNAIAVTNRPGLIGALLVGVTAAKTLAYSLKIPLVPIHHLEGHLMSAFLSTDAVPEPLEKIKFPALFLIASGGHTQLHCLETPPEQWTKDVLKTSLMGRSLDDAAGEAFDKTAKILGFPYPGGKWVDQHSKNGARDAFSLPRGLKQKEGFDFSFSGLKTALMLLSQKLGREGVLPEKLNDVCASVQEAIVEPLVLRTISAARFKKAKSIVVVGGVAANSRLRDRLVGESPVPVFFPDLKYCTDNAAMIAAAGACRFTQGALLSPQEYLKLNGFATSEI